LISLSIHRNVKAQDQRIVVNCGPLRRRPTDRGATKQAKAGRDCFVYFMPAPAAAQALIEHRLAPKSFRECFLAADTSRQSYFRLFCKLGLTERTSRIDFQCMIYFIDIVGSRRGNDQPEILSRIIDHESNPDDAKRKAASVLAGVSFVGADVVRVLDRDGIEIFLWKPDNLVNC
jgi:hypothetical protein